MDKPYYEWLNHRFTYGREVLYDAGVSPVTYICRQVTSVPAHAPRLSLRRHARQ